MRDRFEISLPGAEGREAPFLLDTNTRNLPGRREPRYCSSRSQQLRGPKPRCGPRPGEGNSRERHLPR